MTERPQSNRPARHLKPVPTRREVIDLDGFLAAINEISDPHAAEIVGATWWASAESMGTDLNENILRMWLPACERVASRESAGVLAILAPFSHPIVAEALAEALDRLAASGVHPPSWADELSVTPTIRDCVELRPMDGDAMLLAARFDRPTFAHSLLILLGAHGIADQILLLDADELPDALADTHSATNGSLVEAPLSVTEFRERVEYALAARAGAEAGDPPTVSDVLGGDEPSYHALVPLIRARLRELP